MKHKITRVLLVIAFLSATAIGTAPTKVFAGASDANRVEGSWYITVSVTEPIQATFDATYAFAKGGAFTRIDGRNNAPAVGTWKYTDDGGVVFSNVLFNFTNGVRNGAIAGKFSARVINGTLTGTFSADGILGLTGFHRSGTFTGTPIVAEGPFSLRSLLVGPRLFNEGWSLRSHCCQNKLSPRRECQMQCRTKGY